jgi:hypothetical protein
MNVFLFPKTVVAEIRAEYAVRGMLIRVIRRQRSRVYRVSFRRHEQLRRILKAHPHLAEGSVFHQLSFCARLSCITGIREARGGLQQRLPLE